MKFGLCSPALSIFLLFLLLSSSPAAKHAANEPGLEERGMKKIASTGGSMLEKTEGTDDLIRDLMGEETCEDGDEECLKRRFMSEAHLDYIYTQQHKH
ncbi:putative phytosulfokines 6 [Rhodamnia argentea]|uniref:Phytosulfokine n=1 Tax=Rhodamnia argentea TaxID=178133 RepID=A0A8B8NEL6_9MYRT|nr:putative phytosulfokines 6 [Rhodamnia argentea]